MTASQEQYLPNEETEEKINYLKSLFAIDLNETLMENRHEFMGHSTNSKVPLIVYDNTPSNLECFVTMAQMLRHKKRLWQIICKP